MIFFLFSSDTSCLLKSRLTRGKPSSFTRDDSFVIRRFVKNNLASTLSENFLRSEPTLENIISRVGLTKTLNKCRNERAYLKKIGED